MKRLPILAFCVLTLMTIGCSNPDYRVRENMSARMGDDAVRYGSVAALGTGGYFLGSELTDGSVAGGVAGAAVGAGAAVLLNSYGDKRKQAAYDAGIEVGAEVARAEIVNEKWRREAIYGLPPEGAAEEAPLTRRVFVQERRVNGVLFPAGYQEVQVYR